MTEGGEQEARASWSRHIEFIITCIGFAVGLGNVWRFPHLAYENGGGAFLIPYFICLIFLGIPLFCLEILFGQFASRGPINIWEINPLFKGLGYTMVMLAAVISIYYNIVVAYAIYFLFASMQSELPWMSCGNDWNTCHCRTPDMPETLDDPMMWYDDLGLNCTEFIYASTTVNTTANATAYANVTTNANATSNANATETVNITANAAVVGSSEEYFYNHVLEITDSIGDAGALKWDITLCNLLAWIIICLALIKGVKSMGKAVYFSALFPYVLLTILVIRGVTLDGAGKGIDFYLTPDTDKLMEAKVWKAAASQIFFSLSCCTGSLTAMSSYNKFNNNCFRDSILVPIINCATSFYAGFAIFSVLGYMSASYGKDVAQVTTSGPGLVFVAYPEALGEMPVPQLWSILFFLMMICLGMGTQFPGVETIMTAFQDEFPVLRKKWNNIVFRVLVCLFGFILGLPQTTQGGFYLFDLCDIFMGFPLLLVGFFEIVAIVWVYGPWRFSEDILLMVGQYKSGRALFYYYLSWNWFVVTPLLILAIVIYDCVEYVPITGDAYPEWSEALGWLIVTFIMMWIPLWYLVGFCVKGGARLLVNLSQPSIEWGPANPEDRTIPRYQRLLDLQQQGHSNNLNIQSNGKGDDDINNSENNDNNDDGFMKHPKKGDLESQQNVPETTTQQVATTEVAYDNPSFEPDSKMAADPPPYESATSAFADADAADPADSDSEVQITVL